MSVCRQHYYSLKFMMDIDLKKNVHTYNIFSNQKLQNFVKCLLLFRHFRCFRSDFSYRNIYLSILYQVFISSVKDMTRLLKVYMSITVIFLISIWLNKSNHGKYDIIQLKNMRISISQIIALV